MTITELLTALLEGKKIRHKLWKKKEYIYFKNNIFYSELNGTFDGHGLLNNAHDYEIYQEKQKYYFNIYHDIENKSYRIGRLYNSIEKAKESKFDIINFIKTEEIEI